jgi:hypothetical protein
VLTVGTPSVDGADVPRAFAGWVGIDGGVRRPGSTVRIAYSLDTDRTTTFRPPQPTDGYQLPVLVTPDVAASAGTGGTIPLDIEGENVTGRIAGIIQRFPSIVGGAVVADRLTSETMLDTVSPGLGTTNELWADSLPSPPPPTLTVASRAELLATLRADPLARGALATLGATGALALALALLGLLLGIVADRRDERGELFDLEAQGASPATIRMHLRVRALLLGAFGLLGGLVTGAVLSALVLSLVEVTASSTQPEPPLRLAFDLPLLAAVVVGYALIGTALVLAATRLPGRSLERAAEAVA